MPGNVGFVPQIMAFRTFYAVKCGFITDFRLSPGGGETAGYESSALCRSNVKWLPPGGSCRRAGD